MSSLGSDNCRKIAPSGWYNWKGKKKKKKRKTNLQKWYCKKSGGWRKQKCSTLQLRTMQFLPEGIIGENLFLYKARSEFGARRNMRRKNWRLDTWPATWPHCFGLFLSKQKFLHFLYSNFERVTVRCNSPGYTKHLTLFVWPHMTFLNVEKATNLPITTKT